MTEENQERFLDPSESEQIDSTASPMSRVSLFVELLIVNC